MLSSLTTIFSIGLFIKGLINRSAVRNLLADRTHNSYSLQRVGLSAKIIQLDLIKYKTHIISNQKSGVNWISTKIFQTPYVSQRTVYCVEGAPLQSAKLGNLVEKVSVFSFPQLYQELHEFRKQYTKFPEQLILYPGPDSVYQMTIFTIEPHHMAIVRNNEVLSVGASAYEACNLEFPEIPYYIASLVFGIVSGGMLMANS